MSYIIQTFSYVTNQEIREMCFRLVVDLAIDVQKLTNLYVLLQMYLLQQDFCPEV